MASASLLRSEIESFLGARIPSALTLRPRPRPAVLPFGIAEIDVALKGIPRGCLTEITGPASSGVTSLLHSLLASATRNGECCALVDVANAFDPLSAKACGVELERLLWVRCTAASEMNAIAQSLKTAEMLLETGGFGLVALDMACMAVRSVRRIPLATWFRFRRAVEGTRTALLALGEKPTAANSPALVLLLRRRNIHWQHPAEKEVTHACLLRGMEVEMEVTRAQHWRKPPNGHTIEAEFFTRWA